MNYKQLIESTVIPIWLSPEDKTQRYNQVSTHINGMIPTKLYRFRSYTERNLDAFFKDQLWFSNGSTMNDDFDARLYYDKKKITKWLDSFVAENGILDAINQIRKMDAMPPGFEVLIPNSHYVLEVLKNIDYEQATLVSNQIISFLKGNLDSSLVSITKLVQSKTKFACFSERIGSDMMWGQYAQNATGFALEYEFGKECTMTQSVGDNGQSVIWTNLFPIIYGNRRMDTTAYALYLFQVRMLTSMALANGLQLSDQWLNAIVPCPDEFMVTKLALKKSTDWKSEKEWRLFYVTNDMMLAQEQYSHIELRPSAVYLGRKISDINQKIIVDIAREKDIPVYKMDFNKNSQAYRLKAYKVE